MGGAIRSPKPPAPVPTVPPMIRTTPRTLPSAANAAAIAPTLVLLIAFGIRASELGRVEIGGDEAFTYDFITRSVEDIIRATLAIVEPHPIGSYVAFKASMALFGESEFSLRFLSALCGVLAVAMAGRLARRVTAGPVAAPTRLIAMALMAVSPFTTYHSRELRMYSLALALSLAATLAAMAAWRSGRARHLFAYAITVWLGLHMHYYFIATVAALNLAWLVGLAVDRGAARARGGWLLTQAATAALYAPWLAVAGGILGAYRGNMASPDVGTALQLAFAGLLTGGVVKAMAMPVVTLTAALAVAATATLGAWSLVQGGRARMANAAALTLCMLVPLALVIAGSLSRPIFRERYFVAAVGPFCVLCAAAVASATSRHGWSLGAPMHAVTLGASSAVVLGMLAGTGFLFADWGARTPDWRRLATVAHRYTQALPADRARVVLNYPDPAFSYYFRGGVPFTVLPPAAGDEAGAGSAVASFVAQGAQRVVFQLVPSFWDDREIVKRALEREFNKIEETYTGRWIVQVYGRRATGEIPELGIGFGDRVTLARGQAMHDAAGRLVEIALAWQAGPAGLRGGEKVFLHVSDASDPARLVGQLDLDLTGAELQRDVNVYGVRLADPLPPGEYVVRLGVYSSAEPGLPRFRTSTDGQDAVVLARFSAR